MQRFLLVSASVAALAFAFAPVAASAADTDTAAEMKAAVEKAVDEKVEETKETVKETVEAVKEKAAEVKEEATEIKEEVKAEATEAAEAVKEAAPAPEQAPAEEAPKTLLSDAIADDADLDTFAELLKKAGLEETLADTNIPHTIFAPTDSAFDDMDSKTLKDLENPENKDKLAELLNFHIVNGEVTRAGLDNNTSEVLTSTLKRLRVVGEKGNLTVNGIEVKGNEVKTDNGILFKIEKVITAEAERPAIPVAGGAPAPTDAVATGGGMPDTAAPAAPADFVPAPKTDENGTAVPPESQGSAEPAGESAVVPENTGKKPWYKFW